MNINDRNVRFDDQLTVCEESNPEDHIYEEIGKSSYTNIAFGDEEESSAEETFLQCISPDRRKNLKLRWNLWQKQKWIVNTSLTIAMEVINNKHLK